MTLTSNDQVKFELGISEFHHFLDHAEDHSAGLHQKPGPQPCIMSFVPQLGLCISQPN